MIYRGQQTGISYTEVLLAIVLIAISIVPASQALHVAIAGSVIDASITTEHFRRVDAVEKVLADSFRDVEAAAAGPLTPSSYSEPVGTPDRMLVYVSGFDADNADADNDPFTGADSGLLWIRVNVQGSAESIEVLRYDR